MKKSFRRYCRSKYFSGDGGCRITQKCRRLSRAVCRSSISQQRASDRRFRVDRCSGSVQKKMAEHSNGMQLETLRCRPAVAPTEIPSIPFHSGTHLAHDTVPGDESALRFRSAGIDQTNQRPADSLGSLRWDRPPGSLRTSVRSEIYTAIGTNWVRFARREKDNRTEMTVWRRERDSNPR